MTSERRPWRRAALHADRRWLAFATLLFIATVALGAIVADWLPPLDVEVLAAFRGVRESPLWPVFAAANLVGYPLIWDTAVLAVAAVVATRRGTIWLAVAAAMFAAQIVVLGFKLGVDRLRPPGVVVLELVTDASYPSGHVARVAATAGTVLFLAWPALRRRGALATALGSGLALGAVLIMCIARLAAGEHWPTDVLGGVLVGGAVVAAAVAVLPARAATGR